MVTPLTGVLPYLGLALKTPPFFLMVLCELRLIVSSIREGNFAIFPCVRFPSDSFTRLKKPPPPLLVNGFSRVLGRVFVVFCRRRLVLRSFFFSLPHRSVPPSPIIASPFLPFFKISLPEHTRGSLPPSSFPYSSAFDFPSFPTSFFFFDPLGPTGTRIKPPRPARVPLLIVYWTDHWSMPREIAFLSLSKERSTSLAFGGRWQTDSDFPFMG